MTFAQELATGNFDENTARAALIAMHERGESAEEVAAFAAEFRSHSVPVNFDGPILMDSCGTGGSGKLRFNVSTLVAFVLAAAELPVLKHGNRSSQGRCGSFDLLEALGVNIDLEAPAVEQSLKELGIGLAFAPKFHPAFRHVKNLRASIPHKTIFNLLGPLLNPGPVTHHILGVGSLTLAPLMIESHQKLGMKHALVVHGDGLDEFTLTGPTELYELRDGQITQSTFHPNEIGMDPVPFEAIMGGDTARNTTIARDILNNYGSPIHKKLVALNAGAALYLAGKAKDIPDGFRMAMDLIESGAVKLCFERLRDFSHQVKVAA